MRQRGFIQLSPVLWAAIAAGAVILGLGLALKVQSVRLDSERVAHETTKQKHVAFVSKTRQMGEEAKAKAQAEIKRQQEVSRASAKSYESRLAALNAAYRSLRDNRADSGQRPMSPIPNAPVCPDGTASRDQLLAVLRAADEQTLRLQELQRWVTEQRATR